MTNAVSRRPRFESIMHIQFYFQHATVGCSVSIINQYNYKIRQLPSQSSTTYRRGPSTAVRYISM